MFALSLSLPEVQVSKSRISIYCPSCAIAEFATNKVNKKFFGLTKFQAFIDKKFDDITDRLRKDGKSGNKLFNARDREMAAIFGLAWRPIE